jgi:hypothetical protein
MKRVIISLVAIIAMAVVFNACQKEDALKGERKVMGNEAYVSCESQCIELGSEVYYAVVDQEIVTWGSSKSPSTKTVDVEYYNTETHFVLKVKSTEGWSDLVIDGVSVWTNGPVAANTWGTYSYELDEDWAACDNINFALQVSGNGPPAEFVVNYDLIGLCGCEVSLVTDLVCGETNTLTVTFIPEEDGIYAVQGGLNANAVIQTKGANGLTENTTHPSTINSTASVTRWEGNLTSCDPVTVTIEFTGNCSIGTWSFEKLN